MRAETRGVGERGGLRRAAARLERGEIADAGAFVPEPPALVDPDREAEVVEPRRLRGLCEHREPGVGRRVVELLDDDVGDDVARTGIDERAA